MYTLYINEREACFGIIKHTQYTHKSLVLESTYRYDWFLYEGVSVMSIPVPGVIMGVCESYL